MTIGLALRRRLLRSFEPFKSRRVSSRTAPPCSSSTWNPNNQQLTHPTRGSPASSSHQRWLDQLQSQQSLPHSCPSSFDPVLVRPSKPTELSDEIEIYGPGLLQDRSSQSSHRWIPLSLIGLLITSGLAANQIRHHGAGPVWKDSKSDWSDFQLELWDPSTRKCLSIGLITFGLLRSLKSFFTLSHTIKRITIKRSDIDRFKSLIKSTSRTKNSRMISNSKIELKFYSIGSLETIYPINKLFKFSIFDSITLQDLVRFPIDQSTFGTPRHAPFIWLKHRLYEGPHHPTPDKPTDDHQLSIQSSSNLPELNSLALQIPKSGVWGHPSFGLDGDETRLIFEKKVKSVDELIVDLAPKEALEERSRETCFLKMLGLDFRQSIAFNLIVLKSILAFHSQRLFRTRHKRRPR